MWVSHTFQGMMAVKPGRNTTLPEAVEVYYQYLIQL
jgi:hypothetical protein